jgi:cytoskeleton protein RodZ
VPGPQPVGAESPGRVLRSAREALGLSRREIAEALNLLESTVVAIEDDDTARQPEPVFLRGYVRNYAKLLRLDPEPLVAALNSDARPAATPVKVPKPLRSNRWLWPVAGALVATLILVATVVYLLEAPSQDTAARNDEASADDLVVAEAEVTAAGADRGTARVERWDPSVPPAVVDGASTQNTAGESVVDGALETGAGPDDESGAPLAEVVNGSQSAVNPLSAELIAPMPLEDEAAVRPGGDVDPSAVDLQMPADSVTTIKPRRLNRGTDQIRLDFAQDCWVRVKDSTGKMLFSDMGRAGGAMELTGTGPFDLLLGNAPGTTLEWNGEPIALQPFMRNNVATLKLGEPPLAQADEPKPE